MSTTQTLDYQINRLGFWSVIVAITTGVVSMFFPLDAPGGYTAEHAERVAWLSANRGAFIAGWLNQIVAIRFNAVDMAKVKRIADKEGRPIRATIREIVRRYQEEN